MSVPTDPRPIYSFSTASRCENPDMSSTPTLLRDGANSAAKPGCVQINTPAPCLGGCNKLTSPIPESLGIGELKWEFPPSPPNFF